MARAFGVLGIVGRHPQHHLGELAHRMDVAWVADIEDLAAGDAAGILDDPHQRADAVRDIGERALLRAAVDQPDRLAAHDMAEELRDHARAAFLRLEDRIQPRSDPVERPEQRVVQALLDAIGVDHAVHQLLGAGIDPARLVDRTVDQRRGLGIERLVAAHAVDLRCRREHQVLAVLDRGADDRQVGLEVQLEHPQRLPHVGRRRGDRHQRQHGIALADVVLDPFLVDRDVALEEMHARMVDQLAQAGRRHVHAIDFPRRGFEDASRQMVADETIDAEDQDFLHGLPDFRLEEKTAAARRARPGTAVRCRGTARRTARRSAPGRRRRTGRRCGRR